MRKRIIKGVQSINKSKSYIPDESLVSFIQEWLHIHKKRAKLTKEGKDLTSEEKERIKKLDRMKVYHLDNTIFPAMANLVYFFEAVGSSKILSDGFEDDLIELLNPGNIKSAVRMDVNKERFTSSQFRRNNLARLIMAILNVPRSKDGKDPSNFRISLMYQLQNIVGDEMEEMIQKEYSYSQIWISSNEDYNRMKGWLALLARTTEDYNEESNRNLGFLPIGLSNKRGTSQMEF